MRVVALALVSTARYWPTRSLWRPNSRRHLLTDESGRHSFARKTDEPVRSNLRPKYARAASAVAYAPSSAASVGAAAPRRVVVTIHGYLGIPRPFLLWNAPLSNDGYTVVDYAYDSGLTLVEIASGLNDLLRETLRVNAGRESGDAQPVQVDFVCHSMGGLVLRAAIDSGDFPIPVSGVGANCRDGTSTPPHRVGHVIMVATPNQGSEYARKIAQVSQVYAWLSCSCSGWNLTDW